MENRTKRDKKLISLVSSFEQKIASGQQAYLDESTLQKLINYYEDELMYHKAIEVLNIALDQYRFRSDLYIFKARILYKLGNFTKALANVNKAQSIAPYELEIQILKARILGSNGQLNEALELVNELKLKTHHSDLVEVYICESHIYETMQDLDKMFDSLVKALDIAPGCEEALERIWFAVELSKRYIDSIRFHEKLLNKDPYSYLGWFNLGHALSCIGEYSAAIDALEYAFIVNKDFSVGYLDCADICCQTKNYSKALEIYKEYFAVFGYDEELLIKLSECQFELGMYDEAKSTILKSIELDPYCDESYFILAKCYAKKDNWSQAIKGYLKAIAIEDLVEDYYLGLGKAFYATGAYSKAEQYLRKAALMAPEDCNYWVDYVVFLLSIRDLDKAFIVLNEASKSTFSAGLLYCEFAALHFAGKREEGIKILEEALMENIDEHSLLYEIEPEFRLNNEISSMIKYYMSELIAEKKTK